jgi:formylglycine-generating enzyme required for sulfatase activity
LLTGAAPERSGTELVIEEETGLVFVLLPRGVFLMGAQAKDPGAPNFDRQAQPREGPPHEVELAPFFISKYEVTQAQWIRFTGQNPSTHGPSDPHVGSLVHPAEQMGWGEAKRTLERMGLALPTEAQWEYAARAGTDTPWWTGSDRDSLIGAANLADQSAAYASLPWASIRDWPELNDGYVWHGPVTDSLPNPFGLYGVHGGLWEMCRDADEMAYYERSPRNDPVHIDDDADLVIVRGGSFSQTAAIARSYFRGNAPVAAGRSDVGVRPARPVLGEFRHE